MPRHGFTLFEVAVSMAILAIGLTVMLTLIPLGLRTQEQARSRMLAAIQVNNMIDSFGNLGLVHRSSAGVTDGKNPLGEPHSTAMQRPWLTHLSRRSTSFDLEDRVSSLWGGMAPVPMAIARRLDSPNGEIASILDQGGYIYYTKPGTTGGFPDHVLQTHYLDPPAETGKLVFGVVGFAQQNAAPVMPVKQWPWYSDIWAPPQVWQYVRHANDPAYVKAAYAKQLVLLHRNGGGGWLTVASPEADEDMSTLSLTTLANARLFLATAAWYIKELDSEPQTGNAGTALNDILTSPEIRAYVGDDISNTLRSRIDAIIGDGDPSKPQNQMVGAYVTALRMLALAGNIWVRAKGGADLTTTTTGETVPASTINGAYWGSWLSTAPFTNTQSPPVLVKLDTARYWTEAAMHATMRYAASYPYDWSTTRPSQRPIMMDVPLLQYDLFPSGSYKATTTPDGRNFLDATFDQGPLRANPAAVLAADRVSRAEHARSGSYQLLEGKLMNPLQTANAWQHRMLVPTATSAGIKVYMGTNRLYEPINPDTIPWGDPQHFNLTAPFHPTERCRQIVAWSVDWQSYEDFESAPSAPVDSSRFATTSYWPVDLGVSAPKPPEPPIRIEFRSENDATDPGGAKDTIGEFMDVPYMQNDDTWLPYYRNPEKTLLFLRPTAPPYAGMSTGPYADGNRSRALPSGYPMLDSLAGYDKVFDAIGGTTLASFNNAPISGFGTASIVDRSLYADDNKPWSAVRGSGGSRYPWRKSVFSGLFGADRNGNAAFDRGPTPASVRLRATEVVRINYYDPRLPTNLR